MRIVVEGEIYSMQKEGGVSRIFNEILPRICSYDERIQVRVVLNRRSAQPLPVHERISLLSTYRFESLLRPSRLWQSRLEEAKGFVSSRLVGDSSGQIWHATYYRLPEKWKGAIVVTAYDAIYERFKKTWFSSAGDDAVRARIRASVGRADKVIAISETTKRDVQETYGVPSSRIQVIPLACGEGFKRMGAQTRLEKPFVLYVGSRHGYKGFRNLCSAFGRWSRNRDVDLVVVGAKWSGDELRAIEEESIAGKVRLLQAVGDDGLCALYNSALALAYPSLYEGFGIPLLEAMACGCPIVASRIPSTVEIAADIPIYHEPGQCDGLLSSLEQAYVEGRAAERTGRGLERVRQFSWERAARDTLSCYRGVAS